MKKNHIDRAENKHIDEIMEIWLKTNVSAHAFIPKSYWENHYDSVRSALPKADLFIYRERDTIIGFIGIINQSYIAGLFIRENFQGHGIGRKLINHCKQKYARLALDVYSENVMAVHFYQNNDFKIISKKTDPEIDHEEYHMTWSSS